MEVSSLFGNNFQPILSLPRVPIFTCSSQIPFSAQPSRPLIKNSLSTVAATTSTIATSNEAKNGATTVPTNSSKNVYHSYNSRQSAIRDIQQSSDLASALARSGQILRIQDLNVVLRHFGKLNSWQELSQLFDWMKLNGKTNIASYSGYIKLMGRNLQPMEVLEIYNDIKDESTRKNVSVCNSVLSCLIKNGKFESSLKLFAQMKLDGVIPDIVTYSTLLVGCTKAKDGYSKALELVQELKHNGLSMDSVIYGTLISVCASNNQTKEAEKYFDQLKSEGHSPNIYHYSSMLNAYSVDGNYKKADELICEMKSAGLVLNKVTLTTLLKVYVKAGLFEKSRELLKELDALGYAKDEMPYCLLMDGLAKAGQTLEAKLIFDEMKIKQVKADGYSYSIMISAFCRSGLLEDAKQLATEFEARYDKYDVVISNTMLCAYCRAGEMDNVMKMMKKMDDLAISPDWNTFHILIKYFFKEKLYLLAYRTMEDMHRKGHHLEEGLCSALIYHLGKAGAHSEAFAVYNMLKYSKRTMSRALHEKILRTLVAGRLLKDAFVVVKDNGGSISWSSVKKFATAFMKSGNVNFIHDVLKVIHSSGHKINQELFYMAISRYVEQPEKKEMLFRLLRWMPAQGYSMDSSMRDLILKNSHLFGQQSIVELLSKQRMVTKARSCEMKAK